MAFNAVQVINRLLNVSIEESFNTKMLKKGVVKTATVYDAVTAKGTDSSVLTLAAPSNKKVVPLSITIGADDAGIATISYKLKTTDTSYKVISAQVPADGGTFVFKAEGIVQAENAADIKLTFKAKNANTKAFATMIYSEI